MLQGLLAPAFADGSIRSKFLAHAGDDHTAEIINANRGHDLAVVPEWLAARQNLCNPVAQWCAGNLEEVQGRKSVAQAGPQIIAIGVCCQNDFACGNGAFSCRQGPIVSVLLQTRYTIA